MTAYLRKSLAYRFAIAIAILSRCSIMSAQNATFRPPARTLKFLPGSWSGEVYFDGWGKPMPWEHGDPNDRFKVEDIRDLVTVPAADQCYLSYDAEINMQFTTDAEMEKGEYENPNRNHDESISQSLKSFGEFPALGVQFLVFRYINQRSNTISLGEILEKFKNQTALNGMELWESQIGPADLKPLMAHPSFRALYLRRTPVNGSLFAEIKGHPGLEHVKLVESRGVQYARGEDLLKGLDTLPRLNQLEIEAGETLSLADMDAIGKSSSLTTLTLVLCQDLDREALMRVQAAKNLVFLAITLRNISDLRSDPGLFDLIGLMPKLRRVDLSHTNTSNEDIPKIVAARNLQRIDLNGTEVTSDGIARLRAKRPDLDVIY